MSTLELKDLSKVHPDGTQAVAGIDLAVEDGEFFVLVGPSGCGKTTVLRMVAGLEPVTAGEVLVDGVRVNDVPANARDVAMVFQDNVLYPHLTVGENIGFALRIAKVGKRQIERKVAETARLLQLTDLLDRYPAQLSGGQQQRAAMGRAIVRTPRLLLMDEPMSNLDAKLRTETRFEIMALHQLVRGHDALRHARSGRGDGDGRPGGGDARRPDRAMRHADRALRPSGRPVRRPVHRHRRR